MWSPRLRPPTFRWIAARGFSSRINPRSGPRNTLRKRELPRPVNRRREAAESSQLSEQSRTPEPSSAETSNPISSTTYDPAHNSLLSPVHIPEDPNAVLKGDHLAATILANSGLVVQRQLEMMNVMIGFEQANKYVIMDAHGNHVGYMAEQERGIGNMLARQWLRTHRSFITHVFDRHENEVLRFHRPFSWINSRIRVYDPLDVASSAYSSSTALQGVSPGSLVAATGGSNAKISPLQLDEMRVIGEAQQVWAPLRRKYDLFLYHHPPNVTTDMKTNRVSLSGSDFSSAQQTQVERSAQQSERGVGEFTQFAYVNEPFLSWDFSLRSADDKLIGSVNRNFAGFAREIFTDTGVYALRMDSATVGPDGTPVVQDGTTPSGMTLDQRAVMLATAVSIDFDYFSRHSHAGGHGFMPLWIPGMGGEAAAGGTTAGGGVAAGAGEAGVIGAGEAAAGTVGRAGAAAGVAEGAAAGAAGAGAMAGYDAMQRGLYGDQAQPPQPSGQGPPTDQQYPNSQGQTGPYGDVWADENEVDPTNTEADDPWNFGDFSDGDGDGGDGGDWF